VLLAVKMHTMFVCKM